MTIQDVVSNSLKKGTGRALLIIKDNQSTDFSEIIFNACIEDLGYDPQCEGDRAEYLYEIIQASKQSSLLERKLTEKISSEEIEGWDLTQLFAIVKIFAANGNRTARTKLYEKFRLYRCEAYQAAGISETLIDLNGLEALKFIAEIRGKELLESISDWDDNYSLNYTKEIILESNPLEYLKQIAIDNQYVQAYLNKIEECEQSRSNLPKVAWTYETIKAKIQRNKSMYGLRRWGDPDVMLRIAEDFVNEADTEISKKYLKAFRYYKFPLDFKHLIPFTKDSDELVRHCSLEALSYFENSDVREIALNNLNHRIDIGSSLKILANNFQEQDYKLIEQVIVEEKDDDDFHYLIGKVNDICEKNQTKFSLNALQTCYQRGHCSICRKTTVEIMLHNQILPNWIREEAAYDCNFELRKLIMMNK